MNTFRLWARRLFVLSLLMIFVSTFWYLWHFRFCLDMFTAGTTASCLTMLVGYMAWRAKNIIVVMWQMIFASQKASTGRQE